MRDIKEDSLCSILFFFYIRDIYSTTRNQSTTHMFTTSCTNAARANTLQIAIAMRKQKQSSSRSIVTGSSCRACATEASVKAPPRRNIGVKKEICAPRKVAKKQQKKKRGRGDDGPGGALEEDPGMFDEEEDEEGDVDDGDDGGSDDVRNGRGGDGGRGDDENDDDDDFIERFEEILARLEHNYQNLEYSSRAVDPYTNLNGLSGELSLIWTCGSALAYFSATKHFLEKCFLVEPFLKSDENNLVTVMA